tara:strand:+ start:290 stop:604 length:315 start_codon:yes stop_codon:yes gene_type:complete
MLNSTEASFTMPDIPSNTTPVIALIIAIAGMVSNLFLHYKVKHIEMGCIKSDCQEERKRRKSESPPETPPLPPPTPPTKKKHHVHFPPDDVDEIQLKALSDLEV